MINLLQIFTFYGDYLDDFYRRHPNATEQSYEAHQQMLLADGFCGGQILAPYIRGLGYMAEFVVANCRPMQEHWCREHGLPVPPWPEGALKILIAQVVAQAPDVLYVLDPIQFDSAFLRMLPTRPKLVLGWRAAPIPESTDWSLYDGILTSSSRCKQLARARNAPAVHYAIPGFAPAIASTVHGAPKQYDVLFSGTFGIYHETRTRLLLELAKAPLMGKGDFTPAFFLHGDREQMPAGLAMHNQGARWGIEMYKALASSRIVINSCIDIAENEGPNMRLFEATGSGSFVLTEHCYNIEAFFEPGVEVETFHNSEELLDKIQYYLVHADEREAIAACGHARCLRDYGQPRRALAFDRLFRRLLASDLGEFAVGTSTAASGDLSLATLTGANNLESVRERAIRVLRTNPEDDILREAFSNYLRGETPGPRGEK